MDWNSILITLATAIVAAVTGILVALTTGFKDVILAYAKRYTRKIQEEHIEGLRLIGEYMRTLDDLCKLEYVDRIIIFCGQNGGGKPQVGKPYTIRATYGWSNTDDDVFYRYNFDMPIDADYYYMISDLMEKKVIINITVDMKDGSVLKAYYKQEKVVCSALFMLHLSEEDNNIYYISIGSYKQVFTPDQISVMKTYALKLESLHKTK